VTGGIRVVAETKDDELPKKERVIEIRPGPCFENGPTVGGGHEARVGAGGGQTRKLLYCQSRERKDCHNVKKKNLIPLGRIRAISEEELGGGRVFDV